MQITFVLPDYFEELPKACYGGWGRYYIVVAPDGRALPCHGAYAIPSLELPNVRQHSIDWIWHESSAFQAFRGDAWMKEPCRSCPRKAVDFGGCRCQALALTGDAANADPVCTLSPAPASDRRGAARARRRRHVRLPRLRRPSHSARERDSSGDRHRRARARLRRRPSPRRAGPRGAGRVPWSACSAPTARARPPRCCCSPRFSRPPGGRRAFFGHDVVARARRRAAPPGARVSGDQRRRAPHRRGEPAVRGATRGTRRTRDALGGRRGHRSGRPRRARRSARASALRRLAAAGRYRPRHPAPARPADPRRAHRRARSRAPGADLDHPRRRAARARHHGPLLHPLSRRGGAGRPGGPALRAGGSWPTATPAALRAVDRRRGRGDRGAGRGAPGAGASRPGAAATVLRTERGFRVGIARRARGRDGAGHGAPRASSGSRSGRRGSRMSTSRARAEGAA